jgi:Na+/proline symporter
MPFQKFITIKDDQSNPKAAVISIFFNSIRQYFPIIIGLCGRVIFPDISDPELVVPQLIGQYFPNIIGGIMLASIIAAIMSTTDSLLHQAASEVSRNVVQLSLFKKITEKQSQWIVRIFTVLIGALGVYSAVSGSEGVFSIIAFAFVA